MSGPATPATGQRPVLAEPAPQIVAGPCLRRLARRLAATPAGTHDAVLAGFWAAAECLGTPLVEPVPGQPEHRTVTFLWRGGPGTRQVLLLANRIGDRANLAGQLLRRLPGTDVWHLSYRLRADHRASYQFAVDEAGQARSGAQVAAPVPPPWHAGWPGAAEPGQPSTTDAAPESAAARQQDALRALAAHGRPDPRNPDRIRNRWRDTDSSVFALPHAPAQPWSARRARIPRGRVERHRLAGAALGSRRDVWAYLPPGGAGTARAVVLLCDGDMWFDKLHFEDTLDAVIADGAAEPLIVLSPSAVDNATRWRDLGCRDAYVDFLADEVLPWAARRWPAVAGARRTAIAGQSLGGCTALYAGLRRPDRFGAVLAQSPSLWWRPGLPPCVPKELATAMPWLATQFADAARPGVRVHLDVGLHEGTMVELSRALHRVLDSLGYPVTRTEYNGGHDYACWRGHLADGLVTVLNG